jgi:asparagine synthase (glutamine-hydrolysing)
MIGAALPHYVNTTKSISLSFRGMGFEADFTASPDKEIWVLLDGSIQIADGPLQNASGSAGKAIVEALSEKYQSKGEEFLQDLSGSFRLALWDGTHQKLIVAVDPFATRPLYFFSSDRELFFSPRISCFSAIPDASREIDPNVLFFYLNHSFIPAPRTIFRDVSRLEPGCYLHWQGRRLGVHQYWDIRYQEDSSLTEKSASELIRSEVERSVRSYLEAQSSSQQEVGAFLSGGTDSSTLVGLMTKVLGDRVRTFSVGFAEERYNEIEYARIAAARYNSKAYEYFVSADEALAALPMLAAEFDEPFGNSSAIPTYFCLRMAKENDIKVMVAGDGGDELFAGNERYLAEKYFLPFDVLPTSLQTMTTRMSGFLPAMYPFGKIKRYIERAGEPNPKRFFHYQIFLAEHADEFFTADFKNSIDLDFPLCIPQHHYHKVRTAELLNRLLYMDLKMCIADNDLFKVNRMAEASGIDVCYPFLDRKVAEMTGKIPAALKLKGKEKRYIFRKAFKTLLPEEILRKKKHGFGLPIARWLRTHSGFREMARSLILDNESLQRGYFKRNALENLLDRHDQEKSDFYASFIWNFVMLELWHRNYNNAAGSFRHV